MSLVPKLSVSISNSGNSIDILEKTGPYVININTEGWGNTNPTAADIDFAFIEVFKNENTTVLDTIALKNPSLNLYSNVAGYPVPAEFPIIEAKPWQLGEGVFRFKYKIYVGTAIFLGVDTFELFMPSLCNCRDKLIQMLIETCESYKLKEIKDLLDQVEILIYGANAAFTAGDFNAVDNILANGALLCASITDCGCGCK